MSNLFSAQERLLTPPTWTGLDESLPLVFIAGPIQGAPDYQTAFAKYIINHSSEAFVASPRRTSIGERDFNHESQLRWEQNNLSRAAFNGVTAFWFAAQDHRLAYETGRAYAQTSRIEFGQLQMRKQYAPETHVHVGFDPEYVFHGGGSERTIRELARRARIQVWDSIDDLQDAVLEDLPKLSF